MAQISDQSLIDTVSVCAAAAVALKEDALEALVELKRTYGVPFALLDGHRGDIIEAIAELAGGDWLLWSTLCSQVALRGKAELIDEREPLVLLAVPLGEKARPWVAVAPFLTRPVHSEQDRTRLAEIIGISPAAASKWAKRQRIWSPEALLLLAAKAQEKTVADTQVSALSAQVDALSSHLAETYEEIALLYRLTENLRLSDGVEEIGGRTLDWLLDVLPAEGVAAVFSPATRIDPFSENNVPDPWFVCRGDFPGTHAEFTQCVARLGVDVSRQPVVFNASGLGRLHDAKLFARNLVVAPLVSAGKTHGYLAAANHYSGGEFGTVEARLLGSVATILGIHCGNVVLYREQSELFAGVVRALSSAIDAKDQYTCGHSDRVARVAVRLAEELGMNANERRTLHLAGLLHDIGKIGIKDEVLRKPGKLTPEEYEHIKLHPALGYEILRGIKKIEHVLPAVLHHHESWDGQGYPHGLVGEAIPFIARIVAVADAFDAMGSDRPYRKGMDDDSLDTILRAGAGKQWDAHIIEAFFRARGDIREISRRERENLQLDLQPLA